MKLKYKNIYTVVLAGLICIFMGSCSDSLDEQYLPQGFYLNVVQRDTMVKDSTSCTIPMQASSAWTTKSSASWCTPTKNYYIGDEDLICSLELNRGEGPRQCAVYITMITANKTYTDSVVITQEVSLMPEVSVEIPTVQVSSNGGPLEVAIKHNFGVSFSILSESSGNTDWFTLPEDIMTDSKDVVESIAEFDFEMNTDVDREVSILLTNTQPGVDPFVVTFTQKAFAPAVTYFADDFEDQVKGSPTGVFDPTLKGWDIQSTYASLTLKSYYHTTVSSAVLFNMANTDIYTAWMITPPINVSELATGQVSVKIGSGNTNVPTDAESIKIVYSTDFDADAAKATWVEVIDGTIATPAMGVMKKHTAEIPDEIADHKRVVFAIQYIAGKSAYRVDEFAVE
ncbi:MAG: hypothetical protein R3Y26_01110 [Rikenellaceae bacterium]